MNRIEFTSELFTASHDHRVDFALKHTRAERERKFPLCQETLSPFNNDNYSETTASSLEAGEDESLINDCYGLTILPTILYTNREYVISAFRQTGKKVSRTNTHLPCVRLRKSTTTSCKPNIGSLDRKFKQMTNQEDIKDFNNYSQQCMDIIDLSKKPTDEEVKSYHFSLSETDVNEIKMNRKKLAVFDLDETLSHCEMTDFSECNSVLSLTLMGKEKKFGLNVRPYLYDCLTELKKKYILVCYTASQQLYGQTVLNQIDPHNELFSYRLFRHNCLQIKFDSTNKYQVYYVKDLRIFHQVSLSKIVIIDNSILSFAFQMDNGIPILPFYSKTFDEELKSLSTLMDHLASCDDVKKEIRKMFPFAHQLEHKSP